MLLRTEFNKEHWEWHDLDMQQAYEEKGYQ